MPTETQYKHEFRKLVGCWSEAYETRSGSGMGYPDLQLLVRGRLLPVELKVGVIRQPTGNYPWGLLNLNRVKPTQISWHHEFLMAGGKSWVVVCTGPVKAMEAWALPSVHRDILGDWRSGYPLTSCSHWVSNGKLITDLENL